MRKEISIKAQTQIDKLLASDIDDETRKRVLEIQKDPTLANDAFGRDIAFGTAGLRGLMDVGPDRINSLTIRKATQGLVNYIKKQKEIKPSIAICHDPRINSRAFAMETARVLAHNNISVYITSDLRPTPFLSFALRELHCTAGINITASHNPMEYNGYKVYYKDGAQITTPHDTGIIDEVEKIPYCENIELSPEDSPLIHIIDQSVEKKYLKAIKDLSIDSNMCENYGKELSIVYSPLNGAGITMIPEALNQWGFSNITLVDSQKKPDGHFPTIPKPNPELKETLKEGIELLKSTNGHIFLASDPDSDRLSCSILHNGEVLILSGNEFGTLLLHYILERRKNLPNNFATVTTIVSTRLVRILTEAFNGNCFETLTGFKYIGEKIHQWEINKEHTFLFGMEESLGYLYGTHARDKDATIAACLAAEMTLYLKQKNLSLIDQLYSIYQKYGLYREGQRSIEFTIEKKEAAFNKLEEMRKKPPITLGNLKVIGIIDYLQKTDLPKANVLSFELEDHSRIILRPSGTEPKIKIYGSVTSKPNEISKSIILEEDRRLEDLLSAVEQLF